MNKASVLIDVVAVLQNLVDQDKKFLEAGDDYPLSFEERYALQSSIGKIQGLINHFQEQIEAEISAYETAQGM